MSYSTLGPIPMLTMPSKTETMESFGKSSPNTDSIKTRSTGIRSENSTAKKSKNVSRVPFGERQFMSWDGEGGHGQYWLFGCSDGDYVQAEGLTTYECFALLMRKAIQYRDRIHIAFGFNYDVTMLTVSLPDRKLQQLKDTHHTSWGRWHLEWMPNKWFRIYDWRDKVGIRIYDGMTFFQRSFVSKDGKIPGACEMILGWDDERLERVRIGKAGRDTFEYSEIDNIRSYMFTELSLSDSLFETLRSYFAAAGIHPRGWYGPGAVASALLKRERVGDHLRRDLPEAVLSAATYAYFGGRFESFYTGSYEAPVFSYDIRSAYPHALRLIPSLRDGEFHHRIQPRSIDDFALYHVRYDYRGPSKAKLGFPHPFPLRDKQNRVFYPPHVEGWYWGPEVKAALKHFPDAITISEGWVYEQASSGPAKRPFAFVEILYRQRAKWKAEGNGAQLAAKLSLNSLYGKLAQRVGWDTDKRLPPRWHQLEYAGFITSYCRAMIYTAMMQAPADIIAVETDGIYSKVPLDLPLGTELGQWEHTKYSKIIYVQSGVYWTVAEDGTVNQAKVRGFGSGSFTYAHAVEASRELSPLVGRTRRFGAISGFIGRHQLRTWMDGERVAQWGGGGKRAHATKLCHKCNGNGAQLHNLITTNFRGGKSHPHFLPWKAAEGERNEYQEASDEERFAVV